MTSENKVRFSWVPPYSWISKLLATLDNEPKKKVSNMMNSIWDQRGNPQNPVDWSDPDTWIVENLEGDDLELARRIWEESEHIVNPRYTNSPLAFITRYELLTANEEGVFQLSDKGRAFLNELFLRTCKPLICHQLIKSSLEFSAISVILSRISSITSLALSSIWISNVEVRVFLPVSLKMPVDNNCRRRSSANFSDIGSWAK